EAHLLGAETIELRDGPQVALVLLDRLRVDREAPTSVVARAGRQHRDPQTRKLEANGAADRHAGVDDLEQIRVVDVVVRSYETHVWRQRAERLTDRLQLGRLRARRFLLQLPEERRVQLDEPLDVRALRRELERLLEPLSLVGIDVAAVEHRSEERRVGKERRQRRQADDTQ